MTGTHDPEQALDRVLELLKELNKLNRNHDDTG